MRSADDVEMRIELSYVKNRFFGRTVTIILQVYETEKEAQEFFSSRKVDARTAIDKKGGNENDLEEFQNYFLWNSFPNSNAEQWSVTGVHSNLAMRLLHTGGVGQAKKNIARDMAEIQMAKVTSYVPKNLPVLESPQASANTGEGTVPDLAPTGTAEPTVITNTINFAPTAVTEVLSTPSSQAPIVTSIPTATPTTITPSHTPIPSYKNRVSILTSQEGAGFLDGPVAAIANSDGQVYVMDSFGRTLKVFNNNGTLLRSEEMPEGYEIWTNSQDSSLTIDEENRVHSNRLTLNQDGSVFAFHSGNSNNVKGVFFEYAGSNHPGMNFTPRGDAKCQFGPKLVKRPDILHLEDHLYLYSEIEYVLNYVDRDDPKITLRMHLCKFDIYAPSSSYPTYPDQNIDLKILLDDASIGEIRDHRGIYFGVPDTGYGIGTNESGTKQFYIDAVELSADSIYMVIRTELLPYQVLYKWNINPEEWDSLLTDTDQVGEIFAILPLQDRGRVSTINVGNDGKLYLTGMGYFPVVVDADSGEIDQLALNNARQTFANSRDRVSSARNAPYTLVGSNVYKNSTEPFARLHFSNTALAALTSEGDVVVIPEKYAQSSEHIGGRPYLIKKDIDDLYGPPIWVRGGTGIGIGKFENPISDIWIGAYSNNIYVAEEPRVQIFEPEEGNVTALWNLDVVVDQKYTSQVCDISEHSDGTISMLLDGNVAGPYGKHLHILTVTNLGIKVREQDIPFEGALSAYHCHNTAFDVDSDGYMYFGIDDGFTVFDTEGTVYSRTDGFNRIKDLEFDSNGNLWVMEEGESVPRVINLSK
ncbi:hypothetical protein M1N56_07975 [Dehalococcoidia bacterium]|nr:hypothetical protein [Dehalococcoidia bacterium]